MSKGLFSLVGRIALQGMERVNKDMSDAEKKVKEFQRELGKLGASLSRAGGSLTKNLTAPIAGVSAAIGVLSLKTGEYASKLLSLEDSVGMSTDTLQEFENVARKAGVSSDALINTTQKLRGQLEGIKSGTGDAAEVMDQLGISVTNADGSFRDMNDLFPQVLGELNKIDNTMERNIAASKLFGKNMSDLAPVLAMTADEIAAARKEAHDMGRVMGRDALVNADEFRASVANLKAEFGVLSMQIASSFMPILQGQVIPLIQDKVVPVVMAFAGAIKGLAGWFDGLNPVVQNTVLVVGAVISAIGPLLLIVGKTALAIKGVVVAAMPVITTFMGIVKAAGALAVSVGALGVAAIAAAGALTGLWFWAGKIEKDTKKKDTMTEKLRAQTNEMFEQKKAAKELRDEYAKLAGSEGFDPAEMRRLQAAYEDTTVAMDNHTRAMQGKAPLNAREIEDTKKRVRGLEALAIAENAAAVETDLARRQREDAEKKAAEDAKKRGEERHRLNEQRKKDLASLMTSHRDAIDAMSLNEEQLLDKEEAAALVRAHNLKASEEELAEIRHLFEMRRETMLFEQEKKFADIAAEATERIKKEEEEKNKIRENANKQWEMKLIQQSGDRLAILEAERAQDLAAAAENGSDIEQINRYYFNKRIELIADIADEERKAAEDVEKFWADVYKKIEDGQKRMAQAFVNTFVSAVNQLGSIMSGFSRNEEMRLSKEYKTRRAHIEANVADEEERARQLEALAEEEDARRLAIQQKQAKRDKALGVFNTVIDTAKAIVRTLADLGPIAGPIMATAVGALGVAQTAVIVQQPEPFFHGAMIKGSADGIIGQIGERNQDELILPMERGTRQMAEDIVDILQGQSMAGSAPAPIERHLHVHVGTLIADDQGVKGFVRKLRPHLEAEYRRTGARA